MDPLFFLSYASNPALKRFQERFFDDLVEALIAERDILDAQKARIGFYDREGIQLGDSWTHKLAEALRTCRVFVYIQSEAYFSRLWCGREWTVFRNRIDSWMQDSEAPATRPPLMLPVLWKSATRNPPGTVAADIQYIHREFGEAYVQNGLHTLMNLERFRDNYQEFLSRLAQRILQVSDTHALPPGDRARIDFEAIPNAFEALVPTGPSGPNGPVATSAREDVGPRHVVFVYVVGTRAELQNWRRMVEAYGDDGWVDWRPYFPPIDRRVARYAQGVVVDEDLNYERLDLAPDLVRILRKAEADNKIIILVVDSWTLNGSTYRDLMSDFDGHQFRNCCVVVPWNEDDETRGQADALKRQIQQIFSRQIRTRFRFGVTTPEALEAEFAAAINQARKGAFSEIFQKAEGMDYPQDFTQKPVVSATRTG
jgi:FxsC-like protein